MNKLLSVIAGLLMGIGVAVIGSGPAAAWTCLQWAGNVCIVNRPDPPSGAVDCAGDSYAWPGEVKFFTGENYTGWCFYFNVYVHPTQYPSVGDYNDSIRSVKNNTGGSIRMYEHTNYGGASHTVLNGQNISSFTNFGVSSVKKP
jgi:hypothetical protein